MIAVSYSSSSSLHFTIKVSECSCVGPGYRSPRAAMLEGPREKLMYVVCIHTDPNKPDVLSTVDVDPESNNYCQVQFCRLETTDIIIGCISVYLSQIVHKLRMPYVGDELHHSGWNICSSCYDKPRKRDTLVLPGFVSDRVYFIDTSNERAPSIKKVCH